VILTYYCSKFTRTIKLRWEFGSLALIWLARIGFLLGMWKKSQARPPQLRDVNIVSMSISISCRIVDPSFTFLMYAGGKNKKEKGKKKVQ
jgi:hypothetical protein